MAENLAGTIMKAVEDERNRWLRHRRAKLSNHRRIMATRPLQRCCLGIAVTHQYVLPLNNSARESPILPHSARLETSVGRCVFRHLIAGNSAECAAFFCPASAIDRSDQ